MAHDICMQGGKVHMMYVDEPPWHKLGTRLDGPATSAEAIAAANLDWRVKKIPLFAAEFGRRVQVPKHFAITRADTWDNENCESPPIFGIVSEAYTPVQNRDAFAFLDSIVGEGAAVYHTAGALGNGERVWMLVKLPSHLTVIGDDVVHKYLLVANDHRGEGSVQVKFTPVRVVCQNTLAWALEGKSAIRVSHHRNAKARLMEKREVLGIIDQRFAEFEETSKSMLSVQMNTDRLGRYLHAVFPIPSDATEQETSRIRNKHALAEYFFSNGAGNRARGVAGTLWAALNGVTELIDHRAASNMTDERRLTSIWFGAGASVKERAYAHAMELVAGKELPAVTTPSNAVGGNAKKTRRWFRGRDN